MPVILPMSYIEASCLVSIFWRVLSRLTHACFNRPSICVSLNLVSSLYYLSLFIAPVPGRDACARVPYPLGMEANVHVVAGVFRKLWAACEQGDELFETH